MRAGEALGRADQERPEGEGLLRWMGDRGGCMTWLAVEGVQQAVGQEGC